MGSIVPDYITIPKGWAILPDSAALASMNSAAPASMAKLGDGKRRGFRASIRSDTDSDPEDAFFPGEATAYVDNE